MAGRDGRGRQYSVLSAGALNTLENLTAEIDGLEARIASMEKLVATPGQDEEKLNALGEIRQLIGDLDKIQSTKVDAVCTAELHSGKAEAKDTRKGLNRRIEGLRPRAEAVHNALKK